MVVRAQKDLAALPGAPALRSRREVGSPLALVRLPAAEPDGGPGAPRRRSTRSRRSDLPTGFDLPEHELLRATVTASPTALAAVDAAGLVVLWNPAAERLFGWTADEVLGRQLPNVDPGMRAGHARLRDRALAGDEVLEQEVRRRHRDGHALDVLLSTVAVCDSQGRVIAALGAYQDISARKAAEAELIRQARMDDLTGLLNRRGLLERMGRVKVGRQRVAVLVIDLDHFKQVNDLFGHGVADQVLRAFARRLSSSIRASDVAARLEGAAFGALLTGVAPGSLKATVRRLFASLSQSYTVDGQEVPVKVTGGVAALGTGDDPVDLLRRAGVAMRRAKQVSPGGFQMLDEVLDRAFLERVELASGLLHAADRGQLRLHFQPIVAAGSKKVVGFEALVRWQHPERGLIGPDEFIPLAEETGSIFSVGRWVVLNACKALRSWTDASPAAAGLTMAVNVSMARLQDQSLVGDVRRALLDSGLQAGRLCLEVTESFLSSDPGSAALVLAQLRDLGVRLAIDDFGTGNSSLTALRRFPFQVLKIDRSFVSGIGVRPEDTTIVGATIALAHGLSLTVVAEGVETRRQADFLIREGCEELQGYLFGRPEPAGESSPPWPVPPGPAAEALVVRPRAARV
ncbi:MAG: putative bifunctional diguanylate cyclase/phosphodiesterase [Candidatus Dormibacteria bacterium]